MSVIDPVMSMINPVMSLIDYVMSTINNVTNAICKHMVVTANFPIHVLLIVLNSIDNLGLN